MTNTFRKVGLDNAVGTSLKGYLEADYSDLVACFSKPNARYEGNDKVQAQWVLKIGGRIVTIYDYKNDIKPEKNIHWHVGGHHLDVLGALARLVPDCMLVKTRNGEVVTRW